MAGFGESLGWASNPFYKAFDSNRSALVSGFAGLGSASPRNVGGGFAQGFAQGMPLDQQRADRASEEAKLAEQSNVTRSWLEQQGFTDLVPLVDAGQAGVAYSEAIRRMQPQAGPDPFTLGAGDIRYDGQGNIIAQGPADTGKPTSSMQEYEYARSQGYEGTFQQYETDMKRAGATNIDFNQNQGTAAAFADRMASAHSILDDPALTQAQTDMGQQGLGNVPMVGNFLTSEQKKMADQAQRDFVNAILRRESGAVISDSEFANAAQQYFPQPGDTPAVIEQKKRNREMAIMGVARAAGPAYQPPTLTPPGVVPYTEFFK